jgi:hypothetical protein
MDGTDCSDGCSEGAACSDGWGASSMGMTMGPPPADEMPMLDAMAW